MARTGWITLYSKNYKAQIQRFEKGSTYGIKRGRLSRLLITKNDGNYNWGNRIVNYDRGWDKQLPKNADKELRAFYNKIIKNYN